MHNESLSCHKLQQLWQQQQQQRPASLQQLGVPMLSLVEQRQQQQGSGTLMLSLVEQHILQKIQSMPSIDRPGTAAAAPPTSQIDQLLQGLLAGRAAPSQVPLSKAADHTVPQPCLQPDVGKAAEVEEPTGSLATTRRWRLAITSAQRCDTGPSHNVSMYAA
jgi:hypothetical protein